MLGLGATTGSSTVGACGAPSAAVGVEAVNVNAVAGLNADQLHNAGIVIAVGQQMGLDVRGQTVGVMVALGESGLVNIDVGDAAGPDSRGLFQQRANGAWGTYADRMDPPTASANFFKALQGVSGWEAMSPTAVAHAVQRNQDPNYYTRDLAEAIQIVSNVTGQLVEATTTVRRSISRCPSERLSTRPKPARSSRPGVPTRAGELTCSSSGTTKGGPGSTATARPYRCRSASTSRLASRLARPATRGFRPVPICTSRSRHRGSRPIRRRTFTARRPSW